MSQAAELMRHGDYAAAETALSNVLDADRDTLLRLMETAVIRHLQADYAGSNSLLDQADALAEELYTTRTMDLVTRLGSNAALVTYRAQLYERIYIHYYKIMNYLFLAEQSGSREDLQRYLDAARVESRRVNILLDENIFQVGDYAQARDAQGQLVNQLLNLFASLNGAVINPRALVFRDSAFIHYLIGTLYERFGELDNARISYERAARTYEQGYVTQYDLDAGMTTQAWMDVARILKTQGEQRWRTLARDKLSAAQQAELEDWNPRTQAQLLVIHEVDMMPPRAELNLLMYLDEPTNRLILRPVLTGTNENRAYQLAWFYALYADQGMWQAIQWLRAENFLLRLLDQHQKTFEVGFLRSTLDDLGLTPLLTSTGVRLSVPFLRYTQPPLLHSQLQINGQRTASLLDAENVAGLAMAQHLVNARRELNEAMTIETARLLLCMQTGLPPVLCSLTAAATTAADTRLWLTLPNRIRISRQLLPAGEYQLQLTSQAGHYAVDEATSMVLNPGQLHIWRVRNFALQATPLTAQPAVTPAAASRTKDKR